MCQMTFLSTFFSTLDIYGVENSLIRYLWMLISPLVSVMPFSRFGKMNKINSFLSFLQFLANNLISLFFVQINKVSYELFIFKV